MKGRTFASALAAVLIFSTPLIYTSAKEAPSVSISGSGEVQGGKYNEVKVSGSGDVEGDIEANILKVSGSADVNGNARVEKFDSSGSTDVKGNLKTKAFESSGSLEVTGDLEAESGTSSGSTKVGGRLKAEKFKSSGSLKAGSMTGGEFKSYGSFTVDEDVKLEKFYSYGSFEVGGKIAADHIEISLGGTCKAKKVDGKFVSVKLGRGQWILSLLFDRELEAEAIEGDNIDIDRVKAGLVRGRVVKIGPECRIDKVVYSESIEVDPEAEVGEVSKR